MFTLWAWRGDITPPSSPNIKKMEEYSIVTHILVVTAFPENADRTFIKCFEDWLLTNGHSPRLCCPAEDQKGMRGGKCWFTFPFYSGYARCKKMNWGRLVLIHASLLHCLSRIYVPWVGPSMPSKEASYWKNQGENHATHLRCMGEAVRFNCVVLYSECF